MFLVLRRDWSGVSRDEIVFAEADNWLASSKKDLRSVRLVGVGKFEMVSVMDQSTW